MCGKDLAQYLQRLAIIITTVIIITTIIITTTITVIGLSLWKSLPLRGNSVGTLCRGEPVHPVPGALVASLSPRAHGCPPQAWGGLCFSREAPGAGAEPLCALCLISARHADLHSRQAAQACFSERGSSSLLSSGFQFAQPLSHSHHVARRDFSFSHTLEKLKWGAVGGCVWAVAASLVGLG